MGGRELAVGGGCTEVCRPSARRHLADAGGATAHARRADAGRLLATAGEGRGDGRRTAEITIEAAVGQYGWRRPSHASSDCEGLPCQGSPVAASEQRVSAGSPWIPCIAGDAPPAPEIANSAAPLRGEEASEGSPWISCRAGEAPPAPGIASSAGPLREGAGSEGQANCLHLLGARQVREGGQLCFRTRRRRSSARRGRGRKRAGRRGP